jgi:glyoxylase-like metal-dependent hydrolase (beta-lactamase superfamily II)
MQSNHDIVVEKSISTPYFSNAYILYSKNKDIVAVVDPNIEILKIISGEKINVILTHEHIDHISGLEKMCSKFIVKLFLSSKCLENLNNPKKNLSEYVSEIKINEIIPDEFHIVRDDDLLCINGIEFRFFISPGHSEGSICFGFSNYLVTGDTIIKDYKVTTNLPGGSKEDLKTTMIKLKKVIHQYDLALPGHGDIFVIE